MPNPAATLLLLALPVGAAQSDVCAILDQFLPNTASTTTGSSLVSTSCSCAIETAPIGGVATCSTTFGGVSFGGGSFTVPEVSYSIGTALHPCGSPASASVSASITMPSNLPTAVDAALNVLVGAADSGMTYSDGTLAIIKTATSDQALNVDIPFWSSGILSFDFRLHVTLSGNVDNLAVEVAVDMCITGSALSQSVTYCGADIPTCVMSLVEKAANPVTAGVCTAILNTDINALFGSPPYETFKSTAQSYNDVCNPPPPPPGGAFDLDPPCFAAESSAACRLPAATQITTAKEAFHQCYIEPNRNSGAELVPMKTLAAGDAVLVANAAGDLSLAHVVVNQHKHSRGRSSALLELHHSAGHLSLTPDHVLLIDGVFAPARDAKTGSTLTLVGGKVAVVEFVIQTRGEIINPVTTTGTILASGVGEPVVASTHPEWSAAFMMSSKAPLPLFYSFSAAFPHTTQAYYEAVLEPLFDAMGPHLKPAALVSATLVFPFLAADAAAGLGLVLYACTTSGTLLLFLGVTALRWRKA